MTPPRAGVTLNVDCGELPDEPAELVDLATQLNVACGGHAGDEASMRRVCSAAVKNGATIAAHPSYPDVAGFGRTSMAIEPEALRATIRAQCAALRAIAESLGAAVRAAKPHGALYHDVARDEAKARAVIEGIRDALGDDVLAVGPPTGFFRSLSRRYSIEGFADRGYDALGNMIPRGAPGALITDPARAAEQALAIARRGEVQTLCFHGDTPGAVAIGRAVRAALRSANLLA